MSRFIFLLLAAALAGCSGKPFSSLPGLGSSTTSAPKASDPNADIVPRGVDFSQAPERIAFGSCANQDAPQPIWKSIVATKPDLFLFMGDNVYANKPEQTPIADQYRKLAKIPEFREARQSIPFMVTWDDGDFGTKDGGADATTKALAQREFLNFWRYVHDSMPLGREGIYHSKMIGGQVTGTKRRKRVQGPAIQVIMLDTRTFRSPLRRSSDPANPRIEANNDSKATMLGSAQWAWLANQLRQPAQLRIIVSSIQVVATDHGYEKWANFPRERERLFELLKSSNAKNVIILSGDRHMGSIAKTEIKGWGTLYDITSSSLNKPSNLEEKDSTYQEAAYAKENFGLATVDWGRRKVFAELKDIDGKTIQQVQIPLR